MKWWRVVIATALLVGVGIGIAHFWNGPSERRGQNRGKALLSSGTPDGRLADVREELESETSTSALAADAPRLSFVPAVARSNAPPAGGHAANHDYPSSGVHLGQGWDSFSGRGTTGTCVSVEEVPLEVSSFTTSAREIKSSYSLFKERSLAVAASYSGAGVSASASVDQSRAISLSGDRLHFLFEFKSDTSSTFAVPPGTVTNRLLQSQLKDLFSTNSHEATQKRLMDDLSRYPLFLGLRFKLVDEAQTLLKEDQAAFFKTCGQGFVSAIYRGSQLKVVLSSASDTRESKETLKASVTAKGYGARASAQSSQKDTETNASKEVQTTVLQEGGYPIAPPKTIADLDGVFENVEALLDRPRAYRVRVTPYSDVLGPNADWGPSVPAALQQIAEYYLIARELYEQVNEMYVKYVDANLNDKPGSEYSNVLIDAYAPGNDGLSYLRDLSGELQIHLSYIEDLIRVCHADFGACSNFDDVVKKTNASIESRSAEFEKAAQQEFVDEPETEFAEEMRADLGSLQRSSEGPFMVVSNALEIAEAKKLKTATAIMDYVSEKIPNAPKPDSLTATFDAAEKIIEQGKTRLAAYRRVIGHYRNIKTSSDINRMIYPLFYSFVARIPLTESSYPLEQVTETTTSARSWKHGKYRKTEVATTTRGALTPIQKKMSNDPNAVLSDLIVAQRLLPWARYFCSESLSHKLCVSIADLELMAADVRIDQKVIKSTLDMNAKYEKVTFQYHKDRRGGLNRL